jgi:hypothetical protein
MLGNRPHLKPARRKVPKKGSFDDPFLWAESPSSVNPTAEMSFRNVVDLPESYRIDEFRNVLQADVPRTYENTLCTLFAHDRLFRWKLETNRRQRADLPIAHTRVGDA